MKKRTVFTIILCVLLSSAFCICAFAGNDTPIIPIHTKHFYIVSVPTEPTCTDEGVKKFTCRVCGKSYEESIPPLGHLFTYSGTRTSEGLVLNCSYCENTEVCTAESLEQKWSVEYFNKAPERSAANDSAYLDLNGDNIINAKDYGMIVYLRNKETNLIEEQ